jgi:hypothetical protein
MVVKKNVAVNTSITSMMMDANILPSKERRAIYTMAATNINRNNNNTIGNNVLLESPNVIMSPVTNMNNIIAIATNVFGFI